MSSLSVYTKPASLPSAVHSASTLSTDLFTQVWCKSDLSRLSIQGFVLFWLEILNYFVEVNVVHNQEDPTPLLFFFDVRVHERHIHYHKFFLTIFIPSHCFLFQMLSFMK